MTGERVVSRRSLLRAAGVSTLGALVTAAGLSGCTSTGRTGRRTPDTAAPGGSDVALLTRSLADEERLLAYCTAATARYPALAALLAPVRRVQRQHVSVMRRALQARADGFAGHHHDLPAAAPGVQVQLVTLVRQAQQRRLADCLAAESGLLARMLASASASHAVTLDQLGGHR